MDATWNGPKPMEKTGADKNALIGSVIDELRPWRYSRKRVEETVHREIDALIELIPAQRRDFDQRSIRKSATEISNAARRLERALKNVPPGLAYSLLGGIPSTVNVIQLRSLINREDIADLKAAFAEHMRPFFARLVQVVTLCEAKKGLGGLHPNTGHAQHLCANLAFELMRALSKSKIVGTKLQTIASHLYEIYSGECSGMKRAVDDVLQEHRRLGTLQRRKPYRRSTRHEIVQRMITLSQTRG
jgi:hypothetical protein